MHGLSASASSLIRFGVFEVDLQAGELRKNGAKVRLEGQPLQILGLLLERPGQLVTREELKQKLWAADTFVDFDHSINDGVKRLRFALGDSADTPRFIATLPRRGYRFIYPVEDAAADLLRPAAWPRRWAAGLLVLPAFVLGLLAVNVGGWRDRLLSQPAPGEITSIAVLPLKNLSGDPEQDFFADGMTEALITQLGKISTLKVISHQSMLGYRGTAKPLPQIARELGVDALLEGSVIRSGERVRITVNVIQAVPERHLSAESYELDLREVLAVQRDVARAVAHQVRVKLSPQEQARLSRARTVDPRAYEAYLRGRYSWQQRTTAATLKGAIAYFEQAIEIEPNYAEPYSGLSDCYRLMQFYGPEDPKESWPRAKAAAQKALELDDTLAEAHASLAVFLYRHDWDWVVSEREFKRAFEANPNYADGHRSYAIYLRTVRRFEEARAEVDRVLELDPSSLSGTELLAREFYFARQYDQAIEQGRQRLETDPNAVQAHYWVGIAYAEQRAFPQAVAALERAMDLSGRNSIYVAALAYSHAKAGQKNRTLELLEELRQLSRRHYVPPYHLASVQAALGEKDQAFAHLERAYEERGLHLVNLNVDPMMDPLRSDPRFQALVRRIGLSP